MNNIYFEICAIPVYIIILLTTFIRKTTKGLANELFIALTGVSLIATMADMTIELSSKGGMLDGTRYMLANFASYFYFLLRNGTVVLYLFFVFAITRTTYLIHQMRLKLLIIFPYLVLAVCVLSNPFHHKIFHISHETGYGRGDWILILYVISMMYVVVGTVYVAFCKRFLEMGKWLALLSMYLLIFASVITQFVFSDLLVEMYATSIAFLLVILLVLRPEEITDSSVGLPSWKAYQTELRKIIAMKQRAQFTVIRFINANEIRTYLGEERYRIYVVRIADEIDQMCRRERLSYEIFFEHPGSMYIIFDNMDFDIKPHLGSLISSVKDKTKEIENTGAKLVPRICTIRVPEDLDNLDDILHFGHEFYGLIPFEQLYSQASDIVVSKNFKIESDMDNILSRAIVKRGFEMYYQPIYSIRDQRFVSAEALIRLNDSKYGFVSPGLFIPAAESRGLILPIGDFVLEDVYQFIAENDLKALGMKYIEVNLSVVQCLQKDLPKKIRHLEEKYGVTPDKVNLEITETTYDTVGGVIDGNLKRLSNMGYIFSLDDYGTGYSNMQRVSKLPLQMIKIDKSLVDDMETPDGMSIMRNTIHMMKDIRKELIVEGVETEETFRQLKEMGCDYIQGYYFSKPLPADQFLAFIRKENLGIG